MDWKRLLELLGVKINTASQQSAYPPGYSPHLDVDIYTLSDIRSGEYARQFLSLVKTSETPFIPSTWQHPDKPRPIKIDFNDPDELIKQWANEEGLWLYRHDRSHDELTHWMTNAYPLISKNEGAIRFERPPFIHAAAKNDLLSDFEADLEAIEKLVVDLFVMIDGVYGSCGFDKPPKRTRWGESYIPPPFITRSVAAVHWLNLFGPPYVEMFGGERLRSAPCHKVEELQNGGFLLVLTRTPQEAASPAAREAAQALKEHLGIDYFYDSTKDGEHPNYKQRSTPDFDWSKTPLEPEECKAASAVFVQPQTDPEEFIKRVPALVDNLKVRLGGELDFSKKSIDLIDEWLCEQLVHNVSYNEWQSVDVERELAAYTGEVIRWITGGEWVVEDTAGTRHAVVRYGQAARKHFNPWPLVSEVLNEGVEEAAYEDGGITQTGMNATLFSWMTTHLPIDAAKWLAGR